MPYAVSPWAALPSPIGNMDLPDSHHGFWLLSSDSRYFYSEMSVPSKVRSVQVPLPRGMNGRGCGFQKLLGSGIMTRDCGPLTILKMFGRRPLDDQSLVLW